MISVREKKKRIIWQMEKKGIKKRKHKKQDIYQVKLARITSGKRSDLNETIPSGNENINCSNIEQLYIALVCKCR